VESVFQVVNRFQNPDFKISVSGGPVISHVFNTSLIKDVRFCLTLTLSVIAIFLAILFRRISGVILPIIVIVSAMLSAIGLMAMFQVPIKIMTSVIPAFLLAVGVGDSVHVLAIFYRRFQQGSNKEDAIAYALGHSGMAIVLTSITTAASLLSFSFAELAAIGELGRFAAIGVMLALFYSVIMLPAMLSLMPITQQSQGVKRSAIMDRVLMMFANFSVKHPAKIVATSIVILILSIISIFQLKFSENVVRYLPDQLSVKKDIIFIDNTLKGTITLEGLVDTKKENGLYEPEILNAIETISRRIEGFETDEIYVGKVFLLPTF
jgi:predicted RND superfamily exporter protein